MMRTHLEEFTATLETHAARYDVQLTPQTIARLGDYYEHLSKWNARLHLVAPCAPAEFATRHVLESLMACAHMPEGARVCDVGSGGGLPIIPCLIARADLHAVLVEASTKKSVYLRESLSRLGLQERARVIAQRFEQTDTPECAVVTCRALESFTAMYPRLVTWSPPAARLLLFGGRSLGDLIDADQNLSGYVAVKMPDSEQRFLFVCERKEETRK
ncbi:MAG TPA: RsmG family class I SAM-dependent methyltransferase [Pyrinomonadaceae bacterium]|nr:RsmG family class I SAM-dependent methyltransferase [Pyrinomonadaceae bacterium]